MLLQAHAGLIIVAVPQNCDEQPAYHISDADHAQVLTLVHLQECLC